MRKVFPISIGVIIICFVIHILCTIKEYNSVLTAVPLSMRLLFVSIFWVVILLADLIIHKHLMK